MSAVLKPVPASSVTLNNVRYTLTIQTDEDATYRNWEFPEDIAAFHEHGAVGYTLTAEGTDAEGNVWSAEIDSCWGFINTPDVIGHMRDYIPVPEFSVVYR